MVAKLNNFIKFDLSFLIFTYAISLQPATKFFRGKIFVHRMTEIKDHLHLYFRQVKTILEHLCLINARLTQKIYRSIS